MVVHFVTVAVAFADLRCAVDFGGEAVGFQFHFLRAQPHGAAQIGIFVARFHAAVFRLPFVNQGDHGVRRFQIEFGGIGAFQPGHVARVFNQRNLHAQANAQIGNAVFAGKLRRLDFAFHAARTETAGHQHRIKFFQAACTVFFNVFAVDIGNLHIGLRVNARVFQRFGERFVRLGQIDIFAHHRNSGNVFGILNRVDDFFPLSQVGLLHVQLQLLADNRVDALVVQHFGAFVNAVHIVAAHDGALFHVAEQGDFAAFVFRQDAVHAAN